MSLMIVVMLLRSEVNAFSYRNAPQGIHIALTGVESEMSVMFFTQLKSKNYQIIYSTSSNLDILDVKVKQEVEHYKYIVYQVPGMYEELTVHEFILKGLPPATKIYYRIAMKNDETTTSETFSFITQKSRSELLKSDEPFQFLVYGDMDIFNDGQNTIDSIMRNHMKDTQFILHIGDIPYVWNHEHEYKWEKWFDMIEPITSAMPYIVCNGNHENASNFTSYKTRFTNSTVSVTTKSNTQSNLYYSFDYGSIHFITISSEHDYALQTRWMEEDLAKVNREETPFIIFYSHRPMYSSNENHGSYDPIRIAVEPLLRKYKVDLALFGHVHAYERTCPISEQGVCDKKKHRNYFKNADGTIHIHVGTAGFELNQKWDPKPEWSTYRETNHGYLRIKVFGKRALSVEFLRNGVTTADSFLIEK
ncbi:predicted protein [Naegleria gruberi]|uniref:Purple acid phosphatase n=1 Tax=Naegleria gruberi TaxID=5762 RepID=D2VUU5_NAEGR|nr:uncharacterized protein NAEGRDRAFT_72789 [Naegleria gruberi]EFC39323.1 predicted protein [Naegleria gruberi]|eukprot:XP_002672067.1 predicted protein [Naegleria gruberi strain NEG-M]